MSNTPQHPQTKALHQGHVARVWTIPPLAQYDATTCWEASAHMAYLWKHHKEKAPENGYAKAAAGYSADYLPKTMGELAKFCQQLGMQQAKVVNTNQIEVLLQQSPLVIWRRQQQISHIMLLVGFSDHNWYYINPQVYNQGSATQHTFGEHSYDAGTKQHTTNTVIKPNGVTMNINQRSWHATLRHQGKETLFAQLRKAVFGYFAASLATTGPLTHI